VEDGGLRRKWNEMRYGLGWVLGLFRYQEKTRFRGVQEFESGKSIDRIIHGFTKSTLFRLDFDVRLKQGGFEYT